MKRTRAALVLAGCLAAACPASCALFGGGAVRSVCIRGDMKERLKSAALTLGDIEADAGAESERIARNAAGIAGLLLERRNQALESSRETLTIRIELEENSFMRNFAPVTTVSAMITLHDDVSGETAGRIFHGGETRESLSSHAFLYRFLGKALEAVK